MVHSKESSIVEEIINNHLDNWKVRGLEKALISLGVSKPGRLYKLAGIGAVSVDLVDRYTDILVELGFSKKDLGGGVNRTLSYATIERLVVEATSIAAQIEPLLDKFFKQNYNYNMSYYKPRIKASSSIEHSKTYTSITR